MRPSVLLFIALAVIGLPGCDELGLESASAVAARREAEGKAVGAGCRHAARSVEVCYAMNKRADKAAVFAGWRDMNDYMRENKIEAMPAVEQAASAPSETLASADEADAPPERGKGKGKH